MNIICCLLNVLVYREIIKRIFIIEEPECSDHKSVPSNDENQKWNLIKASRNPNQKGYMAMLAKEAECTAASPLRKNLLNALEKQQTKLKLWIS